MNEEKITPKQPEPESQSLQSSRNDDINKNLLVSIEPLKDPVARGASQAITITVTDPTSGPVTNAQISGILSYPGDNYERKFGGITNSQGKFVYSWIIGNKGDVGPLSVKTEVASPGFAVTDAVASFEIVN